MTYSIINHADKIKFMSGHLAKLSQLRTPTEKQQLEDVKNEAFITYIEEVYYIKNPLAGSALK